jgi:putative solute:sodium symporter small subunit
VSRYWQRNLKLIGGLLVLWFAVSFVLPYFARELNFGFFGWPFSFWLAAQGAVLVFLVIVGVYTWRMERLDDELDRRGD